MDLKQEVKQLLLKNEQLQAKLGDVEFQNELVFDDYQIPAEQPQKSAKIKKVKRDKSSRSDRVKSKMGIGIFG